MSNNIDKDLKRSYRKVSDQERVNLVYMVESENISISKASSILGLNYNNAMAIIRNYRKDNKTD